MRNGWAEIFLVFVFGMILFGLSFTLPKEDLIVFGFIIFLYLFVRQVEAVMNSEGPIYEWSRPFKKI